MTCGLACILKQHSDSSRRDSWQMALFASVGVWREPNDTRIPLSLFLNAPLGLRMGGEGG